MGRTTRDCPLCPAKSLVRLPNHLRAIHGMTIQQLQEGGSTSKQWESTDSDESIDTDESTEQSLTESVDDSSLSDDSESESDDAQEDDPWSALVDDVFDEYHTSLTERYRELVADGMSKKSALKQTCREFSSDLNQSFRDKYIVLLKRIQLLKKDPTYKKINETAKRMRLEDDMDQEEALDQAVERRKILLARILDQWDPSLSLDSDDDGDSDDHDDDDDDDHSSQY